MIIASKVPHAPIEKTLKDVKLEVELGFDLQQAFAEAERCLNCDVQTVFDTPKCIECDACVDICPMDCISFTANGDEDELRGRLTAPALHKDQDLYVSTRAQDRAHHGQGRRSLPALRTVRRALPDRRLGHAEIPAGCTQDGVRMPQIAAVNDFVVKFANVNGSGSASANEMFARALSCAWACRWRRATSSPPTFRACRPGMRCAFRARGWLGRRGGVDLMVAMNPQTWDKDIASLDPGGYLFYDSSRPIPVSRFRDDINIVRMPLTEICNSVYTDPRQRQLFKNIIYVGALAQLLGIDPAVLEQMIGQQYKGKDALIAPNHQALRMGHDYARDHLAGLCKLKIEKADAVGNRIFVSGNEAAGLGCVYGGATVAAWYPITPSTSVAEAFSKHCRRYRVDAENRKEQVRHRAIGG